MQRLLGRNILVYLDCSKNNVEASVAEVECSGVKVVGQDGFRGGNGVKCWGNLKAIVRPLAFMVHEMETEGFGAGLFCDRAFY